MGRSVSKPKSKIVLPLITLCNPPLADIIAKYLSGEDMSSVLCTTKRITVGYKTKKKMMEYKFLICSFERMKNVSYIRTYLAQVSVVRIDKKRCFESLVAAVQKEYGGSNICVILDHFIKAKPKNISCVELLAAAVLKVYNKKVCKDSMKEILGYMCNVLDITAYLNGKSVEDELVEEIKSLMNNY